MLILQRGIYDRFQITTPEGQASLIFMPASNGGDHIQVELKGNARVIESFIFPDDTHELAPDDEIALRTSEGEAILKIMGPPEGEVSDQIRIGLTGDRAVISGIVRQEKIDPNERRRYAKRNQARNREEPIPVPGDLREFVTP